jgi:hypothetical protein
VYGTLNKLGVMKGNKETAKGKAEEKKLGKIADKNTKVIRDVKNKALKRKLYG